MKKSIKKLSNPIALGLMVCTLFAFSFTVISSNTNDVYEDVTITGEVLDMHCYMSGAKSGIEHQSCGQSCVDGGAPIGLLSKDKKVYLLTQNNSKADAYKGLRTKVASEVTVTGALQSRGGLNGIVVSSFK